MPKILVTGDLHVHPHRNDARRIEDGIECLEWIYQVADAHRVDHVVFAGDFLHDRFLLNTYAYAKACEIIKRHGNTLLLLGNHDMVYENRWDIHSLVALRGSNTRVIESACTIEMSGYPVDFLPYTNEPSKHLPTFVNPSPLLISHLPVLDAVLNARFDIKSVEDDSKDKEILPATTFHKWKRVILGHYHYGQKLDAVVEYIGSPMQLSFGEAGQTKHVGIVDLSDLTTEYVVNDVSPKFHIIEDVKETTKLVCANAYVQMRTEDDIAAKFDLRTKLIGGGAREVEFVPPKKDVAAQTVKALDKVIGVINNKEQVVEEFVENADVPQSLDKVLLKSIGKKIVSLQKVTI
jgi:DNA repair exonuclease SbcCD nuclease subunit